jgi:hypothetical protein
LGIALVQTGTACGEAVAEFRKVLELNPGDADACRKLEAQVSAHP